MATWMIDINPTNDNLFPFSPFHSMVRFVFGKYVCWKIKLQVRMEETSYAKPGKQGTNWASVGTERRKDVRRCSGSGLEPDGTLEMMEGEREQSLMFPGFLI